jgi:hypothetical protein
MTDKEQIKTLMAGMDKEALKSAIVDGAKQLSDQDKGDVINQIQGGMAPPSDKIRDVLWVIVISAFGIVLIGSFVTLAIAVFRTQDPTKTNLVKPELVLSMFTGVVGFLAGIFVPSPVANKKS